MPDKDPSQTQLIQALEDNKRLRGYIDWAMRLAMLGLFVWVWNTNAKIDRIEKLESTNTKFWQIHQQTKEAINEDRAADGKPLFKWDIDDTR